MSKKAHITHHRTSPGRFAIPGIVLASLLALLPANGNAQNSDSIDFAHISDTHVISLNEITPTIVKARENNRSAGQHLIDFLQGTPMQRHLQFVLHSGDAIDGFNFQGTNGTPVYGQIEYFRSLLKKSPVPIYLALGNHDVSQYVAGGKKGAIDDQSVAGEARAAWIRSLDSFSKGTFYSFEKTAGATRYLFLILEDGYYGGSLTGTGSDRKRTQHLDHAQLYWLAKQLQTHPSDVPVLVMHVPLSDDEMSHQIEDVLRVFTTAPITLAFVGHLHISSAIDDIPVTGERKLVQIHTTAFITHPDQWREVHLTEHCAWISRVDDQTTAQTIVDVEGKAQGCKSVPLPSNDANRP